MKIARTLCGYIARRFVSMRTVVDDVGTPRWYCRVNFIWYLNEKCYCFTSDNKPENVNYVMLYSSLVCKIFSPSGIIIQLCYTTTDTAFTQVFRYPAISLSQQYRITSVTPRTLIKHRDLTPEFYPLGHCPDRKLISEYWWTWLRRIDRSLIFILMKEKLEKSWNLIFLSSRAFELLSKFLNG